MPEFSWTKMEAGSKKYGCAHWDTPSRIYDDSALEKLGSLQWWAPYPSPRKNVLGHQRGWTNSWALVEYYYIQGFVLSIFKYRILLMQHPYEVGISNGVLYIRRMELRGFKGFGLGHTVRVGSKSGSQMFFVHNKNVYTCTCQPGWRNTQSSSDVCPPHAPLLPAS